MMVKQGSIMENLNNNKLPILLKIRGKHMEIAPGLKKAERGATVSIT